MVFDSPPQDICDLCLMMLLVLLGLGMFVLTLFVSFCYLGLLFTKSSLHLSKYLQFALQK